MDYVVLGYGCKHIFVAGSRSEAVEIAREYAANEHLMSWLLYNRFGELISFM